ncbi:MAG: hypothetical protein WAN13_04810 [Candidatus Acidiferrales bacterium]|jgi:hypothetical protein
MASSQHESAKQVNEAVARPSRNLVRSSAACAVRVIVAKFFHHVRGASSDISVIPRGTRTIGGDIV